MTDGPHSGPHRLKVAQPGPHEPTRGRASGFGSALVAFLVVGVPLGLLYLCGILWLVWLLPWP